MIEKHLAGKHNQKRHGWRQNVKMTPERAKNLGKSEFLEYEARKIAKRYGIKGNSPVERQKYAAKKAEVETRKRYELYENSDGTFDVIDTHRKTSAGFSPSVKSGLPKEKAQGEIEKRVKTARTKAMNDQTNREPKTQDYDLLIDQKAMTTKAATILRTAKILVQRAQTDAPGYIVASDHFQKCALCSHYVRSPSGECEKYGFPADPDYVCDSYSAREPDVGELRAFVERYGARNSRGDLGMLQQVHDLTVTLGAECHKAND